MYLSQVGLVTGGEYKDKSGCQPYPFPECEHHNNHTTYDPCQSALFPTPRCDRQCQSNYTNSFDSDKHFGWYQFWYDLFQYETALEHEHKNKFVTYRQLLTLFACKLVWFHPWGTQIKGLIDWYIWLKALTHTWCHRMWLPSRRRSWPTAQWKRPTLSSLTSRHIRAVSTAYMLCVWFKYCTFNSRNTKCEWNGMFMIIVLEVCTSIWPEKWKVATMCEWLAGALRRALRTGSSQTRGTVTGETKVGILCSGKGAIILVRFIQLQSHLQVANSTILAD